MRGSRRFAVVGALFGIALGSPRQGAACVNIVPAIVSPSDVAPTNTHVWIHGLQLGLHGGATFVLVASDAPRTPIAAQVRTWATSSLWEIVPDAPLAANTRHEIWAIAHPGAKAGPREHVPLGHFTTNAAVDVTPPARPVVGEARLNVRLGSCAPWISVDGKALPDDEGAPFYAVYAADASGKIAYHRPPQEIVRWPRVQRLDPRPVLAIAVRARTDEIVGQRMGLRALDLAGNLGPPAELVIVR